MTPIQLERFFAKVTPLQTGCWEWRGSRMPNGYGQFRNRGLSSALAHRSAYEHFIGPIPEALEVDHLCRNRACVNPTHCEPVPHAINIRRGDMKKSMSTRAKIALAKIGRPRAPFSAEWRENLRKANLGRHALSPEQVEAIARKNRGQRRSDETKARLRAAWARRKAVA